MHAVRARLTDSQGLPGRPWYKNQLYAPGAYTGYSVKTIPAVREAIEQKQWDLAAQSIGNVAKVITNAAASIERAANDLERATRQDKCSQRKTPSMLVGQINVILAD